MTLTSAATLGGQDACRSDGFARLLEALRLLQRPRTVSDVFEAAAGGLQVLGFRRSLVTRVVDGRWVAVVPEGACQEAWMPPDWLRRCEIHLAARHGTRIGPLQPGPRRDSKTTPAPRYAAVPVAPGGGLLGVLFADQPAGIAGAIDEDRDLLTLFAEGMGYVLQRAELAERIDLLRNALNDPIFDTPRGESGTSARWAAGGARTATFDRLEKIQEPLTRRERDIMELVAQGDTNTQVARRLVLSEGTVKWHMKNILRKLGAPNRAAAVSAWLSEASSA